MRCIAKLLVTGVLFASGWTSPAASQIFVSANDGKQVRAGDVSPGPFPDEVVTLSLDGSGKPKVVGRVEVPTTLNGPPVSVAVAHSGRFALIASAQRFSADNKLEPYGVVSAVDVRRPSQPRLTGQLLLPRGSMGIALLRNARLALIACASDDSVAVVSIQSGVLTLLQTIALEPKSEPRDVIATADGRSAYVVRFGDGKLTKLAIDRQGVRRVADIIVGTNPDGAVIGRDGHFLYNTNFGGTALSGPTGALSIVDLTTDRMIAAVSVGQTPEHVALSPDGRFLVVVVGNGSAFTRTAANFADVVGRLKIFRVDKAKLDPIAEAMIGHNCQGAAFSDDGRTILVQCAVEKSIAAFRVDGTKLTPVDGVLTFDGRPGAIASARSR